VKFALVVFCEYIKFALGSFAVALDLFIADGSFAKCNFISFDKRFAVKQLEFAAFLVNDDSGFVESHSDTNMLTSEITDN